MSVIGGARERTLAASAPEEGEREVALPYGSYSLTCPVRTWKAWVADSGIGCSARSLSAVAWAPRSVATRSTRW